MRTLIKRLFDEAVDLPPAERERFLKRECGENEIVHAQLTSLLGAYTEAMLDTRVLGSGEFAAGDAAAPIESDPAAIGEGVAGDGGGAIEPAWVSNSAAERDSLRKFGHFELIRELGRGSQGTVYLALDSRLGRKVALKVIALPQLATPTALERFRSEATVASRLSHPTLCTVYEAGDVDGVPFIAFQYIEGNTLAHHIRAAGADAGDSHRALDVPSPTGAARLDSMLELFETVARGLHAAHEEGLVHRDIKPGNIMVTPDGRPVVLDFGLARDLSDEGMGLTRSTERLGTPAYMPPEALSGESGLPERTLDVYSLGATLYECLTLHPLYEAPTLQALYQRIARGQSSDVRSCRRSLPIDLVIVLETALARDPSRRYRTALDFAEDLHHVREHQPIRARRPSVPYRARQWVRRNPVITLFGSLFALAACAALLASQHAAREESASGRMREAREMTHLDNRRALALAVEADEILRTPETLGAIVASLPAQHARKTLLHGESLCALFSSPDGRRFVSGGVEKSVIWSASGDLVRVLNTGGSFVYGVGGAPDRPRFAFARGGGVRKPAHVEVYDFDGKRVGGWEEESPYLIPSVAISHDGSWILVTKVTGEIAVRHLDGELLAQLVPPPEGRLQLYQTMGAISADDRWIACVDARGGVHVWRHEGGRFQQWASYDHEEPLNLVRFSPVPGSSSLVVAPGHYSELRHHVERREALVLRVPDREGQLEVVRTLASQRGTVSAIDFSQDGQSVLIASFDGQLSVYSIAGERDRVLRRDPLVKYMMARFLPWSYSPFDQASQRGVQSVLTVAFDGTASVLTDSGETRFDLHSLETSVAFSAVLAGGESLVTGSRTGVLQLWQLQSAITPAIQLSQVRMGRIRLTPDRSEIVAFDRNGLHFFGTRDGRHHRSYPLPDNNWHDAAVHPRGDRAVVVGDHGTALEVDLETGAHTRLEGYTSARMLGRCEYSPTGALLVLMRECKPTIRAEDGIVRGTWNAIYTWDGTFSRDGKRVLLATYSAPRRPNGGIVELPLDRFDFSFPGIFPRPPGAPSVEDVLRTPILALHPELSLRTAVYSPDPEERWILTASMGGQAQLWDRSNLAGGAVQTFSHDGEVRGATFSPSGERIGTAGADRSARIWDLEGNLLLDIPHELPVVDIVFVDETLIWTLQEGGRWTAWIADPDEALRAARRFLEY